MRERPLSLGRRAISKALLALPAATVLGAAESPPQGASDVADFIAAHEAGLSADEKERLKKSVGEAEKSLAVIRGFRLPADVAPALRFQALRSKRS